MAYANGKDFARGGAGVSLAAIAGAAWRRWRLALREPVNRALLILFATLQLADIATTNRALASPGNYEVNPLMASLQAQLGAAWWLPKLAVVLLVCLLAPLMRRRWPMLFAIGFYLLVVAGNLVSL
jgi:hypothetical protein